MSQLYRNKYVRRIGGDAPGLSPGRWCLWDMYSLIYFHVDDHVCELDLSFALVLPELICSSNLRCLKLHRCDALARITLNARLEMLVMAECAQLCDLTGGSAVHTLRVEKCPLLVLGANIMRKFQSLQLLTLRPYRQHEVAIYAALASGRVRLRHNAVGNGTLHFSCRQHGLKHIIFLMSHRLY
jgi:hypothetical protein